jgi:hypothetical protein
MIEKQQLRCACGSELKKAYHTPTFTIYGTAAEKAGLDREIVKKLEHQKRLWDSADR